MTAPADRDGGWQLFQKLIICHDLRFVDHAVFFGDLPDDSGGISRRKTVGGDVPGDNASRSDNTAVSNRHARTNHYIGTKPAVIADLHRLCIAEACRGTVFICHEPPLGGHHGVTGGDDGEVGTEVVVVADLHCCIILNGKVVVEETTFPDGCVFAVMKKDRTLNETFFAEGFQDQFQEFRTGFCIIFIGAVVDSAQFVGAQFDGFQFRIPGTEKNALKNLLFFTHDVFLYFCNKKTAGKSGGFEDA